MVETCACNGSEKHIELFFPEALNHHTAHHLFLGVAECKPAEFGIHVRYNYKNMKG